MCVCVGGGVGLQEHPNVMVPAHNSKSKVKVKRAKFPVSGDAQEVGKCGVFTGDAAREIQLPLK